MFIKFVIPNNQLERIQHSNARNSRQSVNLIQHRMRVAQNTYTKKPKREKLSKITYIRAPHRKEE